MKNSMRKSEFKDLQKDFLGLLVLHASEDHTMKDLLEEINRISMIILDTITADARSELADGRGELHEDLNDLIAVYKDNGWSQEETVIETMNWAISKMKEHY